MTRPLRIAIANWTSRRVGGIEAYVAGVIGALRHVGMPVALWHEVDQPVDRVRFDLPKDAADICVAEVGLDAALEALRAWHPDVIYVHGLLEAETARRLQQIAPSVLFLHTYTGTCISGSKTLTRPAVVPCNRTFGWSCLFHYFPDGCGGRSPVTMWRQFRMQSSQLEAMRGYRHILTHSEHMKVEMSKHGLQSDVVPYAVAAPPTVGQTRSGESWRLLFAARMDLLKGGRFLLEALPLTVRKAERPIRLTFAGDGPDRGALEAQARGIKNPLIETRFTGWVSQESVAALLRDADLLVVPSVWPEPFGSIGPMAAQYGVPAAAFDVGGIRTWLEEGVSGHIAPADPPTPGGLADAILRCLTDPQHHAALRRGACDKAARFTMANHLPALLAILERAAGR